MGKAPGEEQQVETDRRMRERWLEKQSPDRDIWLAVVYYF